MAKPQKRFTTPCKVLKGEKPRTRRARNLKKARLQVMKNYEQLMHRVQELQSKIEKHNQKVETQFKKKLKEAEKRAQKKSKPLTWKDRKALEIKKEAQQRYAYYEAYYGELQQAVAALGACEPDIDQVSYSSIRPGGVADLNGTCFGPSQGKVLLEVSAQHVIELEVTSWNDTRVVATVNPIVAEVPLRPHYGKIWLQTGNGTTSNVWPIMYYPIYSEYLASWTKHVFGGVWGSSKNGTFLEGHLLGDGDFTLDRVTRSHWSDGWSELRSPYAGGQSLEQGWHIGVSAAKHAYMKLTYVVVGPKGISPPYISELGGWGWLGDNW